MAVRSVCGWHVCVWRIRRRLLLLLPEQTKNPVQFAINIVHVNVDALYARRDLGDGIAGVERRIKVLVLHACCLYASAARD